MELTRKQKEILDYIERRIGETGCPPTIREIGRVFSLSSTGSVRDYLKALAEKRYIERMPGVSRGIRLLKAPVFSRGLVPVVGRIVAGKPELALEEIEGYLPVDEKLAGNGRTFALKVHGDSMIEAGIREGDYVVVRSQSSCETGEIVAALIGEEATVKRFRRKNGSLFLEPANPAYQPIEFDENTQIIGKVVGLVRYYQ